MLRLCTCTHCELYKEHWLLLPFTSFPPSFHSLNNTETLHPPSLPPAFHGSTRSAASRNIPTNTTSDANLRLTIIETLKINQNPSHHSHHTPLTTKLAFNIRNPDQSPTERTLQDPALEQQNKDKDKDKSKIEEGKKDTMPSKSDYYEPSRSSNGSVVERIPHNPRREQRDRTNNQPSTRRSVVVVYHDRPTGDARRTADQEGGRWK